MAAKNEMVITVRAIDAASKELKKIDGSVNKASKSMGEMAKATGIAAAALGLANKAVSLFTSNSKEMNRLQLQSNEYWGQFGDKIARVIDLFAGIDVVGKKKMGEAAKFSLEEAERMRLETTVVYATRLQDMEGAVFRATEEWERLQAVIAKVDSRLDSIAGIMTDSFLDGIDAMIEGTSNLSDAFRNMVSSMLRQIARLLAQEALFGLFRSLISAFGSSAAGSSLGAQGFSPNTAASWIPSMHAAGGPVQRGGPTTVGEMGRETFVPSTSGYIQRGGGSGDTFNITVVESKDARATAQQVMAEIERNRGFRQRLQLS